MGALENWLKKKAKTSEPKEVEFEPIPIKTVIELTEAKLKSLDKHASTRRMKKGHSSTAEQKLLQSAALQMSLAHYLRELVLLKAAHK